MQRIPNRIQKTEIYAETFNKKNNLLLFTEMKCPEMSVYFLRKT